MWRGWGEVSGFRELGLWGFRAFEVWGFGAFGGGGFRLVGFQGSGAARGLGI